MEALKLAEEQEKYVIDIRRNLHVHPELSGKEEKTVELVVNELKSMGISVELVPNGGVIGILEGENLGKSIILRADIDALPMQEDRMNLVKEKECVSEVENAAHTCGHDGHTAMLLGAAKILSENRDKINGKIIFAFERGEETGCGIAAMINRLYEIGADGIWGIHIQAGVPSGKISVTPGARMASWIDTYVKINGKGGHGSRPDSANNPLNCFVDIYNNLMSMRLNNLNPYDPLTMSIGHVEMGSKGNIIPEELIFEGSIRYLNHEESGIPAVNEFIKIVSTVCALHGCTYEFLKPAVPSNTTIYNNEDCSEIAAKSVETALGKNANYNAHPWMGSDDMAIYLKYFPGIYAFLGTLNEEKGTGAEHHNPHFDLDEDVLKLGVAITVQYAIDFLNSDKEINFIAYPKVPKELLLEVYG